MMEINYILDKIPFWIQRFSGIIGVIISFILVAFLGLTDYLTGAELSFSIFYLIPVTLATLLSGFKWGITVSVVSAGVWGFADIIAGHVYSNSAIPFWNSTVRLGYFAVHTLLLKVLLLMIERIRELSLKDPLTGAYNWRYFNETALRELQNARRSNKPITIAYTDLDNFKTVNDTLGHETGDELLKKTTAIFKESIRPHDLFARIGGDEFSLLLPETDMESSRIVLNRLREKLLAEMNRLGYPVTISMGAVTFRTIPSSVESLIKQADELMYKVKREGKNAILFSEWPEHT